MYTAEVLAFYKNLICENHIKASPDLAVEFLRGITNRVDYVTGGGTPGSKVLCKLSRGFRQVLFLSCVAETPRSGEGIQVCLGRGCPRLRLEPVRLRHVQGSVTRSGALINSPLGRLAA